MDSLVEVLQRSDPLLALAPMQDITDLAFWRVLGRYGGPDAYFTEYFRVYPGSRLDPEILESILENPSGKPVVAQMIGNDIAELVRTARDLQRYPVAGIDLNLGCPAPVVYRKCAGGGLLRDARRVEQILRALRDAVSMPFTVKTRLGFESDAGYEALLDMFAGASLDLLSIHGRTVADGYRTPVRYDLIARAVAVVPCPVLANGNVYSAANARSILETTGARGVMIGRGTVRNPWLFNQIRQDIRGEPVTHPTGRQVLEYINVLFATIPTADAPERSQVRRMKKFMNFIGLGIDPEGRFLYRIRRTQSRREFFAVCRDFLDHDDPMKLEPFSVPLSPHDLLAGEHR